MLSESQCRFCAKLPVIHHMNRGCPTRCPLCKGHLIEDRDSGTTYRYEETTTATPARKSLGSKLAALFGISATAILVWLLIKPHVPEKTVAASSFQVAEEVEIEKSIRPTDGRDSGLSDSTRLRATKSSNVTVKGTEKPVVQLAAASEPEVQARGIAKSRPIYADAYARVKAWTIKYGSPAQASYWPEQANDEAALLGQLRNVPEVGLQRKLAAGHLKKGRALEHQAYVDELKRSEPKLAGLPFLLADCQLSSYAANDLGQEAVSIRESLNSYLGNLKQAASRHSRTDKSVAEAKEAIEDGRKIAEASLLTAVNKGRRLSAEDRIFTPGTLVAVQQLMMDQDSIFRKILVTSMAQHASRNSTVALARRALFDLDADNRKLALQSLQSRNPEEYMPVLWDGLSYPWAVVAHHAAYALASLNRSEAVPHLVKMLNLRDPNEPYIEAGKSKVRELVRINHHRNCLLCHVPGSAFVRESTRENPRPATPAREPLRATIPSMDGPLPGPFSVQYYFSGSPENVVRADVTYLRQDFSAQMEVARPGPWPAMQRFDFLIRARDLNEQEAEAIKLNLAERPSEHKRAILLALQQLTGIYTEETSAAAWTELLRLESGMSPAVRVMK